jgi:hypothetical protein
MKPIFRLLPFSLSKSLNLSLNLLFYSLISNLFPFLGLLTCIYSQNNAFLALIKDYLTSKVRIKSFCFKLPVILSENRSTYVRSPSSYSQFLLTNIDSTTPVIFN